MLGELAHAGVLLLLFAVGLKLRVKTLLRHRGLGHGRRAPARDRRGRRGRAALGRRACPGGRRVLIAVMLGFSSTVLAAKVLEGNRELRAVHGRVAIGILIVQDIVAVALLAVVNGETPSP